MRPTGFTAVMAGRRSATAAAPAQEQARLFDADARINPTDALDFFPTPPWATRALLHYVIPNGARGLMRMRCWEPAAGEGHMAEVLKEFFAAVHGSDVHDHGYGETGSFVGAGDADAPALPLDDLSRCPFPPDWIITNPPFSLAGAFARRALAEAGEGVALLLRTAWLESGERFRLFMDHQPWCCATFAERVPMVEGRWDPEARSATCYSWFVWLKTHGRFAPARGPYPVFQQAIIPPVCRETLTLDSDIARFAGAAP